VEQVGPVRRRHLSRRCRTMAPLAAMLLCLHNFSRNWGPTWRKSGTHSEVFVLKPGECRVL
jgi:hypothetical protein